MALCIYSLRQKKTNIKQSQKRFLTSQQLQTAVRSLNTLKQYKSPSIRLRYYHQLSELSHVNEKRSAQLALRTHSKDKKETLSNKNIFWPDSIFKQLFVLYRLYIYINCHQFDSDAGCSLEQPLSFACFSHILAGQLPKPKQWTLALMVENK